jgi:hypothetical protein
MLKHSMMALTTLAALSAPGPLRADPGTDPVRCEARRMQCDSRRFECLARCDRPASQQAGANTDTTTSVQTNCTTACEKRAKKAMDRIENNPPCMVVPDQRTCEARLLRVGAASLVCSARCASRAQGNDAPNQAACLQACETYCNATVAETLGSPICLDGRVGTDPICGAH